MFDQETCVTAWVLRLAWYKSLDIGAESEYRLHLDSCDVCKRNHDIRNQIAERQTLRPDFDELLEEWEIEG